MLVKQDDDGDDGGGRLGTFFRVEAGEEDCFDHCYSADYPTNSGATIRDYIAQL